MCGIAGIVDFARGAGPSRAALERMQRALFHRGPDGQGAWVEGPCGLAHTRLAIQDPLNGAQPLVSPDGRYVLVYNGELGSAEALRGLYAQEVEFSGSTDTEVVLATLVLEGERALAKLSGMFALFFWDRARQAGFAARDRLGVKPFCYTWSGGQLRFASEVQALVAGLDARPDFDLDALVEWALCPQLSGVRRAPFAGVELLPAGSLLRIDASGLRRERWFRFTPARRPTPEEIVVDEALRRVYMGTGAIAASDQPTGVFLSGGLDSSLISGVGKWVHDDLRAFTVRFEGQDHFDYAASAITNSDDLPFAKLIAEENELELDHVDVSRATLADDLRRIATIDDRVPAWEQELTQHHLAKAAAQKVKVVLVGDAADETHFGYHFLLDGAATGSVDGFLARLGARERLRLLHPELRAKDPLARLRDEYQQVLTPWGFQHGARDENVLATTALIAELWLGRLLHNGDVHTMAFGLEARVPFAGNDLIELAEKVTPAVGLKDGVEKWHLREAAQGELPDAIRLRKKSALPKDLGAEPIYREEARKLVASPPALAQRLLDLGFVAELADAPRALTELERAMLFQAIVLGHWARHHGG